MNNTTAPVSYQAFQTVEIVLPAGTTSQVFNFNDLPFLRPDQAKIKMIEAYGPSAVAYSPVSNTATVTATVMAAASLTLYGGLASGKKQGNQIVQQVPVNRLVSMVAGTNPYNQNPFISNDGILVDWTKSQIQISIPPANVAAAAFVFGVYFDYLRDFN